ncbi:restriction endonuclease subunit S [Candidatus Venteria ishoeyi]|uniref:restriction endonuclease subunit S n=1 Tax=Candidatus Venteria ishoeyi TaxID=1899563 RepID=UPI00255CDB01|nr:restriction endonuclease subunit S [Candidatus Venteria ishoeyi]
MELSKTIIEKFVLSLPPLEEQKEIVKKVEELMKLCNELEKQTLETKENSENLMKAVLGEVFDK